MKCLDRFLSQLRTRLHQATLLKAQRDLVVVACNVADETLHPRARAATPQFLPSEEKCALAARRSQQLQ
jgi:hypothetical protein